MKIIGLTGSIGMGKSTACRALEQMGIACHDSDEVARAAIAPGGVAMAATASMFPEAFIKAENAMDRKKLGEIVFADPGKKKALEEIIHPCVLDSQQRFLHGQKALGAKYAVLDIPLLFETGANARVDAVVVVSCPAFMQRRRVMARPGMTEEKFNNILKSQMPDHEKRRRADFVVQTGLGVAFMQRSLKHVLHQLGYNHDKNSNNHPPYTL